METEKKGSVFGSVLIVIILLGLVVFYLTREKDIPVDTLEQSEMTPENTQDMSTQYETSGDAELEAEVESLDTEFEDMNTEDLDI